MPTAPLFTYRLPLLGGVSIGMTSGVLLALVVVYVAIRVQKILNGRRAVGYLPGIYLPFQLYRLPGVVLPSVLGNAGIDYVWRNRINVYKRAQSENYSVIPLLRGNASIITTNLDVARQVVAGGHRSDFWKPHESIEMWLRWGKSILSSEGELWRKHRRIAGPAFNNDLYKFVWEQTLLTYRDIVALDGWSAKKAVDVPAIQKVTSKLALLIICQCGFGLPYTWAKPPKIAGQAMSFQEAIRVVADNVTTLTSLPSWLLRLIPTASIRTLQEADEDVMQFLRVQVVEKQKASHAKSVKANEYDESSKAKDIFSLLVQANNEESGKLQLDDNELIGNVFIMLFAGHETTAKTLAATLAFMAIYPDIQQEVFEHILSVVGPDRDPTFEDYAELDKVLAVFYEALRMYPAAYIMIRAAKEDTVLNIPNPLGQEGSTSLPVSKGTEIIIDMTGLHYNPRYFEEPEKYKPSRWYGVSNESEVFTAFSIGPRACIGRKFATTEAVCFLTLLLRDWKVEPLLMPGETMEAWNQKVFNKPEILITLAVGDVPLRFTRRD